MKRLISLLLSFIMLFSVAALFAGCTEETKTPNTTQPPETQPTQPEPTIPEGNQIGEKCFSFDLDVVDANGATGETIDPAKTGKVTVINFWGTWCGPCVGELPHFDHAAKNYDISVIAIHSKDYKEDMPEYIGQHYPDSPIVFAWDKSGSNPYLDEFFIKMGNVQGYPYTVVLDEDGIITFTKLGQMTYEELEAAIISAGAKAK